MMKSKLLLSLAISFAWISSIAQNCDINATATPSTITCGQSVVLTAFGSSAGQVVLDEDFNSGGFGPGWSSTPGATSFSNPCSPGGVDGTPHAWMDNNTSVPRTLTSSVYNLTGATAGVSVCFDLLFAVQGDAAPCEGPDEPDEGVYLQYSTDGGATWIDIHYFDPNGGNDPQLTNWNNWCFELPPGAITSNTQIRWHQTADSGADYDHWGIDNVQIFQNDINAEVEWLHDGYSYGVGNPGGDNPTPVSPTSTTTYTAQITTGTGDVCTADVTVTVVDPVYDVNVSANPTTVCVGDCADITGTAQIILDPGGIETYENAEIEVVTGTPYFPGIPPIIPAEVGEIGTSMNINIQTLNSPTVTNSQILSVCVNDFNITPGFGCTGTSLADIAVILVCPSGTEVILADVGQLSGNTITNMCFSTGASSIASGSAPYTGSFNPFQPINNLTGCSSNGVWTLRITGENYETCIPVGSVSGWNITFDDPPVYAPVDISWSPQTGLSNPTSVNTQACPTNSTDYVLTVSTGNPGCEVHTETVSLIVDPCGGCIPPNIIINPLGLCTPGSIDLSSAIGAGSDPATITYHATQTDAQNDVNTIGINISSTGSYWVRYEDPSDPTCFGVQEIIVSPSPPADASFTLTDFCEGASNNASGIVTPGGTFSFNPLPGGSVTINPTTGAIINGVGGTTYTVQYTVNNGCISSTTETVTVIDGPNAIVIATPNNGEDPLDVVLTNGSTNASNYFWDFGNGNTLNTNNLDSQNQTYTGEDSYTVMLVAEGNGCTDTTYVTISLNNPMVIEIPNVFTPNGDLANDVFFFNSIGVETIEITILNRWGNLVFESDDVNFFWNGKTASGQDAKEGVYFFKYQATGFDGTSQEGHGFVTLER